MGADPLRASTSCLALTSSRLVSFPTTPIFRATWISLLLKTPEPSIAFLISSSESSFGRASTTISGVSNLDLSAIL
jgi:hypothetical protein